jgi:hypothetical protein
MRDYIAMKFNVKSQMISIAKHDIPQPCSREQLDQARQDIREALTIPIDAVVYCYNGSIKPWQCPEKTVLFMQTAFNNARNVFLLILTQDVQQFTKLIERYKLPKKHVRIMRVAHAHMYDYLAAADYGLMFREPHVVNWTSRPTKALEYRAAGLKIIHNNTVAMLTRL